VDARLEKSSVVAGAEISISGSKSETNRLLLLQALYPVITLENTSGSDDARAMQNALASKGDHIDVGHAGTAMRFLAAYFASSEGRNVILTGSPRMQQRPIGILVDALRGLGAEMEYLGNEGFPPLQISGRRLSGGRLSVDGSVSSQFLSALLLVAPRFENGLKMHFSGLTSKPYLMMTVKLLEKTGIRASLGESLVTVGPCKSVAAQTVSVESDWSSASYFYALVALSGTGAEITLATFRQDSFQGDRALAEIYRVFGVETTFGNDGKISLRKVSDSMTQIDLQLSDTPDIAQTIAVTCLGLGLDCTLSGLHTLRIKETDRLEALKIEMEKFGAVVTVSEDRLTMKAPGQLKSDVSVATYGDHRMAMAFAPLAVKIPLTVLDAEVVSKSYRRFWDDLRTAGIGVEFLA